MCYEAPQTAQPKGKGALHSGELAGEQFVTDSFASENSQRGLFYKEGSLGFTGEPEMMFRKWWLNPPQQCLA